jgi:molybdenum cofactor synthesis domain-containing protein
MGMSLRIGILTVSDRVSRGEMEDRGGPAVEGALAPLDAESTERLAVPDERERIEEVLRRWADDDGIDLIVTTGGTGLSPRDVTPEAVNAVCDRLIPGIGETMRAAGLAQTPMSMLSRSLAGVRGTTLVIALPGSPRGAADGIRVVLPILQHAISTLRGAKH